MPHMLKENPGPIKKLLQGPDLRAEPLKVRSKIRRSFLAVTERITSTFLRTWRAQAKYLPNPQLAATKLFEKPHTASFINCTQNQGKATLLDPGIDRISYQ